MNIKIGRKIYFDKQTGNIIVDTGEREGFVVESTIKQDFKTYTALAERVPETVSVIQLEYGQYSQDFVKCNGYRVNIEVYDTLPDDRKHEALEFGYLDPNDTESQEAVYRPPFSVEI
ncbi:hypothetical protein [Clostridium thermosuccinogenes]|uniref:hypothetical protein n=1 Tax=Clostridium thermosuccinogenes TaxID=84032 RepID=UPI000CCC1A17|nr:hypothetical protein [Pseudoclostridium thermosuccinogenes]PNT91420.1 hypothetical protein CDQ83_16635 [Pseudoclostridium thermosuccinogenes]